MVAWTAARRGAPTGLVEGAVAAGKEEGSERGAGRELDRDNGEEGSGRRWRGGLETGRRAGG